MQVQEQVKVKERPIPFSGPMVQAILAGRKTMTRRAMKPQPPEDMQSFHQDGAGNWIGWSCDGPGLAEFTKKAYPGKAGFPCPYGKPGERLWVRETWLLWDPAATDDYEGELWEGATPKPDVGKEAYWRRHVSYRASAPYPSQHKGEWRPSIHMPRWASRLLLEVVSVRVERLQDISEADARAEGAPPNWIGDLSSGACGRGWDPDKDGFLPAGWEKMGPDDESFGLWTAREAFATWWDAINGAGAWARNDWVWCVSFKRVEG